MTADAPPGAKNQPQFLGAGAPSTAADLNTISDYAAKVGNRRVDTTVNRLAASGADVWPGLEWYDTDLQVAFIRVGSAWVPFASDWLSYTPTLTNLTVGTGGTVQGEYQYIGPNTIHVRVCFTIGTTGFSMPAGPKFTLPVAAAALWSPYQVLTGNALAYDVSAGGIFDTYVVGMDATSTTTVVMRQINGSSPFVWASGDKYFAEFEYRI